MKYTAVTTLSFLIWASTLSLSAQLQPVFAFQKDDTTVKRKYFNEALKKKEQLTSEIKKEYSKDYKTAYNDMFEMVEELLLSHRTVTEKNADAYIKAVAEKIINANSELKNLDLRIVFTRDFLPNAYSVGDGTIAFNAGLFVYLHTEAEMAFIICHELAHYYLKHSLNRLDRYVQLKNSDSLKKEIKRIVKEEYRVNEQVERLLKNYAFDMHKHSRDKEAEADKVGLQFFKNTGYSGASFITTMQLLDEIDDTTLFQSADLRKLLSFPNYTFKERWVKKESIIFGALDPEESSTLTAKEKDSLKTHPDCSIRIALLQADAIGIVGKDFLIDQTYFYQLQQAFIPELVEEVFESNNVSFNLYLSLQMLQEKKHVPLAIYSVARNLNIIYQQQKEHKLGLITDSENKKYTEGYNLLLRMLSRIRLNELAEMNEAFCSYYSNQMNNFKAFTEEHEKAIRNKNIHINN